MTYGRREVVVFQVERYLLYLHVSLLSVRLSGLGVNLGAGPIRRYSDLLAGREVINVDINPAFKPDVVADVGSLPLRDESVNFALCTQVLGDIEEPLRLLLEAKRVLKPGGYLLLTESLTCELHDEPYDYWRFTRHGLESLCRRAGLEVVVMAQRGGFYATLSQLLTRYLIDKLRLYERPLLASLLNKAFRLLGRFSLRLDASDNSPSNRKFSLGWSVLARKPGV